MKGANHRLLINVTKNEEKEAQILADQSSIIEFWSDSECKLGNETRIM